MKCCDITPGMLREPFIIQSQELTAIGGGATATEYVATGFGKCQFKPLSGSERLYAERIDAVTRNRALMRYRPSLKESDRLVIRGRAYNIRFINNIEFRNRWLEIDLDGGVAT